MAETIIKAGFYVSFAGPVTFKNAKRTVEVMSKVPIERILVETDCPYLAPEPHRGTRNEPAYVRYVAEKLAEVKGMTYEDAAQITTMNACRLFGI
jgi:TatD DNase family protein